MKKKNSLILDSEFLLYCEINNIVDSDKLAYETFERGFSLLKYGETPAGSSTKEKIVEKIVEVIKEVPVEKIVYQDVIKEVIVEKIVEVIKEVPVEKIVEVIKEVPKQIKGNTKVITKEVPVDRIVEVVREVEKIVEKEVVREVVNNKEVEKLTQENKKLKEELEKINTSLEKLNKGRFLKNSDLGSLYSE